MASAPATRTAHHRARGWAALLVLDQGDEGAAAAQIAATGEVLDALAKTSALHTRNELRAAAWEFERASRSHTRAEFRHAQDLRRAARDLVRSGPALGRGEDGAGTAMVLDMLVFLTVAAAHWHAQRTTPSRPRPPAGPPSTCEPPTSKPRANPSRCCASAVGVSAPSLRRHHATTVRVALPELADTVLAEPGWDALAATLADAERAGHNPHALLTEAADATGTGHRRLHQRSPRLARCAAPRTSPPTAPHRRNPAGPHLPTISRPRATDADTTGAPHTTPLITAIRQGTPPG